MECLYRGLKLSPQYVWPSTRIGRLEEASTLTARISKSATQYEGHSGSLGPLCFVWWHQYGPLLRNRPTKSVGASAPAHLLPGTLHLPAPRMKASIHQNVTTGRFSELRGISIPRRGRRKAVFSQYQHGRAWKQDTKRAAEGAQLKVDLNIEPVGRVLERSGDEPPMFETFWIFEEWSPMSHRPGEDKKNILMKIRSLRRKTVSVCLRPNQK